MYKTTNENQDRINKQSAKADNSNFDFIQRGIT